MAKKIEVVAKTDAWEKLNKNIELEYNVSWEHID